MKFAIPKYSSRFSSNPVVIKLSAPITTGIVVVFILHILASSTPRSLHLNNLSISFNGEFFSPDTLMPITMHVLLLWSLMMISGQLCVILLSVLIAIFQEF